MKKLEKEFISGAGGFSINPLTYRQVKRNDVAAVYERLLDGRTKDYEVFKIKVLKKGTQIFEKIVEEDEEHYPSTNEFGRIAWSFGNLEAALNTFEELTKAPEEELTKKNKTLILPKGEFTVDDLAKANNTNYVTAYLFIKEGLKNGTIKLVREEKRHLKGRKTKIYKKVK